MEKQKEQKRLKVALGKSKMARDQACSPGKLLVGLQEQRKYWLVGLQEKNQTMKQEWFQMKKGKWWNLVELILYLFQFSLLRAVLLQVSFLLTVLLLKYQMKRQVDQVSFQLAVWL